MAVAAAVATDDGSSNTIRAASRSIVLPITAVAAAGTGAVLLLVLWAMAVASWCVKAVALASGQLGGMSG